jgi:hypothetical protein
MDGEWEPPMIDNPEYKVCVVCYKKTMYKIFFEIDNGDFCFGQM